MKPDPQILNSDSPQQASKPYPLSEQFGMTIGDIVQKCPTITSKTLVSELELLFSDKYIQGVVIVDEQKPLGLLMKNKLYYHLGTQYGMSLYYQRPAERIMDRAPLIVNADLPLEAVSHLVMGRDESSVYDLIVVVKDGKFQGVVSIIHLLKNLTELQIRCAFNANPLTGLSGNLLIEERLKAIVHEQLPVAVLYLDLDNFKAFNDKYGFEHGDKALLLTANIINSSLAKFGSATTRDFLGHIGGDDFVIITQPAKAESLCQAIIQKFDQEIRSLYSPEDLERGYIKVLNRKGEKEKFPIISVSIAVVHNRECHFSNYLEIGEIAAELKKKAKKMDGSVYLIDKRRS